MGDSSLNSDIQGLVTGFSEAVDAYLRDNSGVHPFDLKENLLEIRDYDEELYLETLKTIPSELLAEIIAELPSHLQEEASERFDIKKLVKIATDMDTDDAADFLQKIGEKDGAKAEEILEKINPEDQEIIRSLISYDEGIAGAYMQSELFSAKEDEVVEDSIRRLRKLKKEGEIDDVSQVFILDQNEHFICSIGLEELILLDLKSSFKIALKDNAVKRADISANHFDEIKNVIEKVSDYNLSVIPVVNEEGVLLGRITSDDVYDLIETQATEEIFSMAGLNADAEQTDDLHQALRQRALWLGVNLLTAIAASLVIALFDSTIQSFVSLAILMPIVASMGGNAGTQSLTVTVRQLSVGEIDFKDAIVTVKKEVYLALLNGLLFAVVIGLISHFWFDIPHLGIVIALSTVINLLVAGLCGAVIPLVLDKVKIDPAISSTVILTTITDILGFLSFLGLAKLMMT